MATRALTQACRVLRVPSPAPCSFRCSSTASHEPTRAAPSRPKPNHQKQQKQKPSGDRPRQNGRKSKAPSMFSGHPGPNPRSSDINPKVMAWADGHDIGFPFELKVAKLKSEPGRRLHFKFSPRHVFRPYHVLNYFTGFEKVLTEYRLYRYEHSLAEPLWVHISGSSNVKPIVRNFARRRVREGIRAALAERGYTLEGRAVDAAEGATGGELRGTIWVHVNDPVYTFNHDKETHVEVGREIVSHVESQQSARRARRTGS